MSPDRSTCIDQRPRHRQQGFTLVELMIALVIGSMITIAAFEIFTAGRQTFEQAERLSDRQESLRYLSGLLSHDIRTADRITAPAIGQTDNMLGLEFDLSRQEGAYCGNYAGGTMSLQHEWDDESGTLVAEASCLDEAEVLSTRLEGVTFNRIAPHAIEVTVTFTPMGEDDTRNDVTFRAINRAESAQQNASN